MLGYGTIYKSGQIFEITRTEFTFCTKYIPLLCHGWVQVGAYQCLWMLPSYWSRDLWVSWGKTWYSPEKHG